MSDIVSLVMVMAAFTFIAYPILFRRPSPVAPAGDERLRELFSKRDTTYSMLKELEFDHGSGILTDEDYQELELRYKRKAVAILRGIDDQTAVRDDMEETLEKQVQRLRKGGAKAIDLDAEVEAEVERLRQHGGQPRRGGVKSVDLDAELERQVQGLRRHGAAPQRGSVKAADTESNIEKQVGQPARQGGAYCHQCGAGSEAGDRFCSRCGTRLREA